jgi:hypothetical protein
MSQPRQQEEDVGHLFFPFDNSRPSLNGSPADRCAVARRSFACQISRSIENCSRIVKKFPKNSKIVPNFLKNSKMILNCPGNVPEKFEIVEIVPHNSKNLPKLFQNR